MLTTQNPAAKILLVDDDMDLLSLMKMKLTEYGFEVNICPNAAGIYSLLANQPPDCILLDLHMDGINGEDICREIKSQPGLKHIPILLVSSDVEINDAEKRCGADGYLSKPWDMNDLVKKVEALRVKTNS